MYGRPALAAALVLLLTWPLASAESRRARLRSPVPLDGYDMTAQASPVLSAPQQPELIAALARAPVAALDWTRRLPADYVPARKPAAAAAPAKGLSPGDPEVLAELDVLLRREPPPAKPEGKAKIPPAKDKKASKRLNP